MSETLGNERKRLGQERKKIEEIIAKNFSNLMKRSTYWAMKVQKCEAR